MGFTDLPLEGGSTTWSNCRSKSRLDRYLVTPSLENHFSKITQHRLPHIISDYFPILLSCGFMQRGKSPFRFENMRLKGEGFTGRVQQWWNSYNVSGSPSFVLVQKLRLLKADLRRWNVEEFGDVNFKKYELLLQIQDLERVEEQRPLFVEERVSQEQSNSDYENLLLSEEIHWRQKSRATWLQEGDKNTRFFHRVANSNRRFNSFARLSIQGVLTSDQDEIGEGLVSFYSELFSDDEVRRPLLDGLSFSSIDEEDSLVLDRSFTEEEVWEVVKVMAGDKAPGPDGFSMAFFKGCWATVKEDMMAVFHEFHAKGSLTRSINATVLVLIPKKPGAVECKDFRPISLIIGVYKIIAKVLANRLKMVLEKLISDSQNAFVGGRQTLDSVLIANESLDSRLKASIPGVLCKLDIEKAYDHVNWNFWIYLLRRCGFSAKWRQWIFACISTACFSILVNVTSTSFFPRTRGLR